MCACATQTGEVLANYLDTPGDFRLTIDSSVNPAAFRALASDELQEFLGQWEWPRSPAVRLSIHGPSRDPEDWIGEGTVGPNADTLSRRLARKLERDAAFRK